MCSKLDRFTVLLYVQKRILLIARYISDVRSIEVASFQKKINKLSDFYACLSLLLMLNDPFYYPQNFLIICADIERNAGVDNLS